MKKNFDYLKDETLQKLAKYGMLSLFIKNQILDREMKKISLSEIEITEAKNLYKKSHKLESDEDFEHHKQRRFYTDESIRYNIELPFKQYKFCQEMFGESLYTNYLKYKSFSELVNKYSEGPERKSQGIIGPVRLNQGHPLLQKQIIQNKDLCFSQPFKIDSKWIIIKVENFIESKLDDFVEKEIYKIELENFLKEEIKKYLE